MKKKLLSLLLFVSFVAATLGVTPYSPYGLPSAYPVAKSDSTFYSPPLRMLFFNATAAQTLTVDMASGETNILFTYAVAGTYTLPISVVKVKSTGTSVTGIVGLRELTGGTVQPSPTATATSTPSATATPSSTSTPTPTPTP